MYLYHILNLQIHKEVGGVRKGYWCIKQWEKPVYAKSYEVGMLLGIFVIPVTIISFAYINICKELWTMTSNRESLTASK